MRHYRSGIIQLLPLFFIITIAACLRLIFPDLIEFKYDETWLVNAAYQVAFKHEIYLVGQDSSIGVPNGALPVYLVALVVRLTRDLVWVSALFVVANLAALVLAYLLVDRYIGRIAAIVMALLYAVSPWTVYFSRKIWIPDLTPLFVVLFWWAAYKLIVDRRAWYLALMWVWAACILQAHLSGVLFPALIILLLVIFPRRVRLLPLLAGILGYGLIFSSYIWWIYLHGDTTTRLLQEFGGHGSVIDGTAAQYGLYLLTGQGIEGLTGESYASYLAERLDFSFLNLLEYAVFGLGFAMLVLRVVRSLRGRILWNDRNAQSAFLLLVWAVAPIVFFTRHSTPTMLHYMLILLPSQFIVTGYAVQKIWRWLWPYRSRISAQAVLAGLVVLVLAWGIAQAYTSLFTYQYISRTSVASTFGIPYRYYAQAMHRAGDYMRDGNRVVILSHLEYPAIEYLSGYAPALRPYDDRSVLPVPDTNTVYMLLPGSQAQGLLASVAQELPPVAGPSDQETIRFYRMGEAERARLLQRFTQLQPPAILKNGLRLTGFSIQQDKNDLNVMLCWRVDDASATAGEYTVFVHLLNKESQLQAQHDQPFAPHATWNSGDTLLSFYRLTMPAALPSGQYNLNAGMYLPSPGTPRVPVRRGDTQLPGDVVTLEVIHLPVVP